MAAGNLNPAQSCCMSLQFALEMHQETSPPTTPNDTTSCRSLQPAFEYNPMWRNQASSGGSERSLIRQETLPTASPVCIRRPNGMKNP
ncbi:hypothetical protein VI817_000180 [Penicillium citrinum]|nr:hypothetical protein VI817_000180 [Penicillium citrinum]